MNKKSSALIISDSTSKENSRITRTLSNNCSSSSIKGKVKGSFKKPVGKQNLQTNLTIQNSKIQRNQNINPLKGLKRIKQKIQGQSTKPFERYKIPEYNKSQKQKNISQNNSNKSLINQKNIKQITPNSDKKLTPLKSQKSIPKSISKKGSLSKKQLTKKSQCLTSLNQIIAQSQIQYTQSLQNYTPQSTPKPQKQQIYLQSKTNQKLQIVGYQEKKNKNQLMISMFEIRNKLNQSSFSTTFQVIHTYTGFLYCLKVFEKIKIKQQGLQEQIITQIKFRRKLNNKNIQKLWTVFDDEVYIYFVEEYLFGFDTIQKQLHLKRRFNQKQAGIIFNQVFQIVRYIHSQSYIHRDIRLQNLARCFGIIKLTDFSWVACLRYKKQRDTFCGTYKYAPPQLLQGQNYDQSIDIWSLGILLYQLTTGQLPFNDHFLKRNSHSMNFPIFLSNQLVDLIGRLLSDKGVRMRIQQILMHEWINKWEIDGFVCKQIWDFWVL